MLGKVTCGDPMDVFRHVRAVRDRIEVPTIRSGVGIDRVGGHFISPYLRRLHELIVGSQGCNAVFLTECVGAFHEVLFHGIHIGIIGRGCGFWMRFRFIGFCLCRRFAGVGLAAFHLHTAVNAVPINIKTDLFANVTELDVVVAFDTVGFHLYFPSIDKYAMGAALGHDPGSIRRGGDAHHQQAGKKTGCKTSSLHGVYLQIL